VNKKSKTCIGLTNIIYKQPYELYLKTIEYKNILKKSKEKKEEIIENDTKKNSSTPMDTPDHLFIKPQVSFKF